MTTNITLADALGEFQALRNHVYYWNRGGIDSVALKRADEFLAAALASAPSEPMFWVRLRSDGCYEGPIHDSAIEDVRKRSGVWTPLYAGHAAPTRHPSTDIDEAQLRRMTEEGAKAWAGVDAQALRDGGEQIKPAIYLSEKQVRGVVDGTLEPKGCAYLPFSREREGLFTVPVYLDGIRSTGGEQP